MNLPHLRFSITAVIVLTGTISVRAAVTYSGLQNISIPTNFDGVYLDIDTGATGTAEFTGWDVNPFFGGVGVANSPAFQPVRTGIANSDPILRLNVGDVINSSRLFSTGYGGSDSHLGAGSNQFGIGQEAYLGFKFTTNASAGPYYGWMRVAFTANTAGAVIKDWAYETSASSITAGRVLQAAPSAGVQVTTLSGGAGESYTLGSTLTNSGANATAVLKTGDGQWKVTGTNNYTGATTVTGGTLEVGTGASLANTSNVTINTGGTLLLSGAGGTNPKLNTAAAMTLDGGKIDLGGMTTSLDQHVGALTLDSNSVIDFGILASGNTYRFADSSGITWGGTLSILNWTEGVDHLFFDWNSLGLTNSQLSAINLYSDGGATHLGPAGFLGSSGEVSAVPEPAVVVAALSLLGLIGARELRDGLRVRRRRAGEKAAV